MADEDDDLLVTLGDPPETAPAEGAAPVKPPPVPGPGAAPVVAERSVAPEIGLKDLEQQVAAERREKERMTAEARRLTTERDRAVQYAREADQRSGTNYEAHVDTQIQAMTEQMDTLASQAEAALGDGDFKTVAEINKRLGRIGGTLAIAEREKLAIQQQREQQTRRPQQPQQPAQPQPQPQAQPTTPLERAIQGRSEPTKSFLRKHPELVRGDGTLKASAIQAHEKALDEGFPVDSDGYFRHIESLIGGGDAVSNVNGNGAQPSGQPAQPVIPGYSAPVARGPGPGSDSLAPGTFRMTPKMRRLAEEQGVSPQEWANNYVRLVKEGRMTPIT